MGEGQSIYQIWMRDFNDLVQSVALAHAERLVFEFNVNDLKVQKASLLSYMSEIVLNYGITLLRRDLSYYLVNQVISATAAQNIWTT